MKCETCGEDESFWYMVRHALTNPANLIGFTCRRCNEYESHLIAIKNEIEAEKQNKYIQDREDYFRLKSNLNKQWRQRK